MSDSAPAPLDALPRWQRRPEARPEEILDAALEVFGAQGFARARLEDVARRAGVSKGTLYLYFESKDALFREMVRAKVVSIVVAGEEVARNHRGTAREVLLVLASNMWQVLNQPETARLARLVHSELVNFPELAQFYYDEVIQRARLVVQGVIERGIAAGEFRPVPSLLAARALQIQLVHFAQFQHFFQPYDRLRLTDDAVFAGLMDLYLAGLAAPSPAAGKDR